MIIQNASVFTNECCFQQTDIYIEGERIAHSSSDTTILDGSGCYLIPGLMDIHFHGCMGFDLCDATPEALQRVAEYEIKNGITSICPASMTLPETELMKICKNARSYHNSWQPGKTARLCGIHLEGPFISPEKRGAQNPAYITAPDVNMFTRLLAASDHLIKVVTIAPELDHAIDFIQKFASTVRISLGHTACDYDTAMTAFSAGAKHITHLYNAMPPFHHRDSGLIGAGMDANATAELICDGIHVSPSALRAARALFGADKIIFISDSMMAAGMPDGDYALGGLPVHVTGNLATLENGTLAGSATNLMDCVRTAVQKMNIPIETAIQCATINPARAIGEDLEYGSIEIGKYADLVLLEKDTLAVRTVISHGIILS